MDTSLETTTATASSRHADSEQTDRAPVLLEQATQLIAAGKLKEAAAILEQAVAAAPKSLDLQISTAFLNVKIGDTDSARKHLQAALRLRTDNPDALHNLAVLLTAVGEFEEAKQCLHKLLVLDNQNIDIYNDLAVIEAESGNIAGAEHAFTQGMQLRSVNKKIFHNYLDFCKQTNNQSGFDTACAAYRKHWHVDPPITWDSNLKG